MDSPTRTSGPIHTDRVREGSAADSVPSRRRSCAPMVWKSESSTTRRPRVDVVADPTHACVEDGDLGLDRSAAEQHLAAEDDPPLSTGRRHVRAVETSRFGVAHEAVGPQLRAGPDLDRVCAPIRIVAPVVDDRVALGNPRHVSELVAMTHHPPRTQHVLDLDRSVTGLRPHRIHRRSMSQAFGDRSGVRRPREPSRNNRRERDETGPTEAFGRFRTGHRQAEGTTWTRNRTVGWTCSCGTPHGGSSPRRSTIPHS